MSTIHVFPASAAPTIRPDELHARLGGADLTVVDVRPLAAYNGWRLRSEPRGGHVPGAVAFPIAWLDSVDDDEILAKVAFLEDAAFLGRAHRLSCHVFQGAATAHRRHHCGM